MSVKRIVGATLVCCMTLSAGAAFGGKGDDKAVAELKAMTEKMMTAWDNGDEAAVKTMLSDHVWGAWDLDMVGKPAAMATAADVIKMMTEMTKGMKAMGATMKSTITRNDCHASGDLGICMVEATGTMTMPGMPPVQLSFRGTDVFQREKGAWKAVHHHGSLAKAPEMPAKFMAMTSKNATWMPAPGMQGVTMAPLWMNPATQAAVMLMKVGPNGMKQTRHMHPAAYGFVVLEGAVVTTDGSGKDTEFGPGSVVYRPAAVFHQTIVKPNSVVFMVTDGPLAALDEKGAPVAPGPAK